MSAAAKCNQILSHFISLSLFLSNYANTAIPLLAATSSLKQSPSSAINSCLEVGMAVFSPSTRAARDTVLFAQKRRPLCHRPPQEQTQQQQQQQGKATVQVVVVVAQEVAVAE